MEYSDAMNKIINYLFTIDPLIGSPPRIERLHNGKIAYIKDEKEMKTDLFEVSSELEVSLDDITSFNLAEFCSTLFICCEETFNQAMKGYFNELDKIISFTENTIDAKGKAFSHDQFLDALEKLKIPFDEDCNPILPTLVIHPSLEDKMKKLEITDEQKKRQEDIISKKREEYLAEKCYRRLSKVSY